MRLQPLSAAIVALVLFGATPGLAQSVSGRLVDQSTSQPIVGATVKLVDPAGQQIDVAITGRTGSWSVQASTAGTYRIQVERVGYARIETDPFPLDVEPIVLDLSTRPEVIVLEELSVQAATYAALLNRSRTRISARTLLPADVESRIQRVRPRNTGQLVRNMIAGMGSTWDDWPVFESMPLSGAVASRGLSFGAADFRSPWDHIPPTSNRPGCTAVVAVDGQPHFKNRPESSLDRLVPLSEVRAVEIFRSPDFLPRELRLVEKVNRLDAHPAAPIPCGVVAIWTREGLGVP